MSRTQQRTLLCFQKITDLLRCPPKIHFFKSVRSTKKEKHLEVRLSRARPQKGNGQKLRKKKFSMDHIFRGPVELVLRNSPKQTGQSSDPRSDIIKLFL